MNKHKIFWLSVVVFLIVFNAPSSSVAQPPPPIGAISGFVINGDSSQPLQNTVVVAFQDGNEIFRDT